MPSSARSSAEGSADEGGARGFSAKAADCWALGVCLYMWLYLKPPFEAPKRSFTMLALGGRHHRESRRHTQLLPVLERDADDHVAQLSNREVVVRCERGHDDLEPPIPRAEDEEVGEGVVDLVVDADPLLVRKRIDHLDPRLAPGLLGGGMQRT